MQRLVLQPTPEANAYGRRHERQRIGAGLSTLEMGLRLRYDVTKRFAPYLGVTRQRRFGGTAAYARADDERVRETRAVAGVRFWF